MYVYAAWVRADAVFVQAIEVADTAAGETLEDEYVSLSFKLERSVEYILSLSSAVMYMGLP